MFQISSSQSKMTSVKKKGQQKCGKFTFKRWVGGVVGWKQWARCEVVVQILLVIAATYKYKVVSSIVVVVVVLRSI